MRKLLLVAVLVATSCNKTAVKQPTQKVEDKTILAKVGSVVIRDEDVRRRIAEYSPTLRSQYRSKPELQRQLVVRLIEEELLYREAIKRKLDRDPSYERQRRAILVGLLQQKINNEALSDPITDNEVRAYYLEHANDYDFPLKVSHILLKSYEAALQAMTQIGNQGGTARVFAEVAKLQSLDRSTKNNGGDCGELSVTDIGDKAWLYRAARRLIRPGQISAPLQSPKGWHLIRLNERVLPTRPPDNLIVQIRHAVMNEKRQHRLAALQRTLHQQTAVQFLEEHLRHVKW